MLAGVRVMACDGLKLSILDFGYTGPDKRLCSRLAVTTSLARLADERGYHRFWFTEHHSQDLYIACPEVVIAAIAASTRRIRVGSAGVLLHYYSPFKVAEVFHTLAALFPNRIDLGVARGIGATPEAADLLRDGLTKPADPAAADAAFERKLADLMKHLRAGRDADQTRGSGAPAQSLPELWLLGSGRWSAELAAKSGANLAMAAWYKVLEPVDLKGVIANYTEQFQASPERSAATACLSVSGICAESDAEADAVLAKVREYYGEDVSLNFCGSPDVCRAAIEQLADQHGVSEINIVSYCVEPDQQERMFRLLGEAMRLRGE
jgi:luciferase family oxidoreductase group 1